MTQPVFIFDFDGTIADTYRYMMEISNRLAVEFHYKTIAPHELATFKDKTSQEILRYLRVPILKLPAIIARAKREYRQGITSIEPITGLRDILLEMKSCGAQMGVFSSNSSETIGRFLRNHNLDIFDFVRSTPKVWSKNISLKRLLHEKGLQAAQVIYVCDEIRDITAVKKCGVRIAAVSWGYNSPQALERYFPDYLLHRPRELLGLCNSRELK